jgi:hypothetical protein
MEKGDEKSLCTKHARCISWPGHPGDCVINSTQPSPPPIDDEKTDPHVSEWGPLDSEGFPF